MSENESAPTPKRLVNFTPLRYPGGKGKLANYVKAIMKANALTDGEYVEPYAGGAAVALELLFHDYVSRIHINDLSRPVYSFWRSVLDQPEELCRLVRNTARTVQNWDKQKLILKNEADYDTLAIGFAMFFLNRTNRSGILNAGIIGGRDQKGEWKIDARYNADELITRIQAIAELKAQINLTQMDAVGFLEQGVKIWPEKTLIYLDPPYYIKGRDLYYHFYKHDDHVDISEVVKSKIKRQKWLVSYDDVPEVRALYEGCQRTVYGIGYSARTARTGAEVMFFADGMTIPPLVGAMSALANAA